MKSAIAAVMATAALSLASFAVGQNVQSQPFNLVLVSDNQYNGSALSSCHEGASVESLCLQSGSPGTYYLNTTTGASGSVPGNGPSGMLTYNLNGPYPESEGMTLYYDPSTNVALPLFRAGEGQTYVAFDGGELMNIVSFLDDEVSPPSDITARALYRWYVCQNAYVGYTYTTLSWVAGSGKPENPSCEPVSVKRVFI